MAQYPKLFDAVRYVREHYCQNDPIGNARLTKILYLADWKSILVREFQITEAVWRFENCGPNAGEVVDTIEEYDEKTATMRETDNTHLESEDMKILDFAMDKARGRDWDSLNQLVISTYPILRSDRYKPLDLLKFKHEYLTVKDRLVA
jgi:hypothetical protein